MKVSHYICFCIIGALIATGISSQAQQHTVHAPAYEFKNTGLYEIEGITLTDTSTRAGFSTSIIYAKNKITDESFPMHNFALKVQKPPPAPVASAQDRSSASNILTS